MSANDDYEVLMESLEFPGSARLRLVLEELMTPEQARMAVALPGTPEEVAQKTGIGLDKVKDTLDDLFFKGIIFPRGDFRKREFYRFSRSMGQFFESTMATRQRDPENDHKFYSLWHDFSMNEFYPSMAESRKPVGKPFQRIVPAYKAIKDLPDVLPCESYPEILKAQKRIAAAPCACRYMETSIGKPCAVHDEEGDWVCLQFGRGADYIVTRGSGKELSQEEALELSETVEENGLLHMVPNNSAMTGFNTSCNCCRDCCMICVPLDQAELPLGISWEKSRYVAYINLEDCNGCQDCVDRCLFDAVDMERPEGSKKYKAVIDPEKCFGCGVCVVGCEQEALKMKLVRPPDHIPQPLPR